MDKVVISESLHDLEKKVLPFLSSKCTLADVVKKSGMQEVEVYRALQWLEQKKIVMLNSKSAIRVSLGKNGKKYKEQRLPEVRFLLAVKEKKLPLAEVQKIANLEKEELNISLGLLKRKNAINFENGVVSSTDIGKILLKKESPEEALLKKLPVRELDLSAEERAVVAELKKRSDIIFSEEEKSVSIELTDLGADLQKLKFDSGSLNKLTPELLRSGQWKSAKFRPYNVQDPVAPAYPGKKHFVNQSIEYAKQVWIEMGFKEMTGSMIQTSFWNFDALFTAQDHPGREMQDTFFLEHPKNGKLPDKKRVDAVKAMHEHGGTIGSTGWQYKWDEKEAMRNVIRTHTTALSAQTLASLKENEMPAKFFAIGKVFRNETLDWKHLFEFNQTEGIVVDPNANFRHLLGYLKEFMKKMGYDKVRFRPAYFPYTNFSVEFDVYHPVHKQWVELGGAGMLRPEVVIPLLGKDVPVLAWGPGFDRIMTEYYKITDLRDLYKNDIKQLREMKMWVK